jgi:hypothetical protein
MIKFEFNSDAMRRASQRARSGKFHVRMLAFRKYQVTNLESGARYQVEFKLTASGHKLAGCGCTGAQHGFLCKHVSAALPLHISVAKSYA